MHEDEQPDVKTVPLTLINLISPGVSTTSSLKRDNKYVPLLDIQPS